MGSERKIYSVAEVNRKARMVLESGIGEVWVEGEVSNLKNSAGTWYFTLKDAQAEISATMFSNDNQHVSFEVINGSAVRVFGRVSIYEKRGTFQIRVSALEPIGKGTLQEQFEKLKAKLAAEGLFEESRKKTLPMIPQTIGIVTAPAGEAIKDMIDSLTSRFPSIHILLAPVRVQGATAASSIAKAIDYFNTRDDIDVMIIGRGGGSLEDLWAFNEEVVARAIAASEIPVISAVGHQGDVLISDYVADARASTPTKAAELVVPVHQKLIKDISQLNIRLRNSLISKSQRYKERMPTLSRDLQRAITGWRDQKYQQVDDAACCLAHALKNAIITQKGRLPALQQSMTHSLHIAITKQKQKLPGIQQAMTHQFLSAVDHKHQNLKRLEAQLRALNPLAVLGRGYTLTRTSDGTVVRTAASVEIGEDLVTQFVDGKVFSNIAGKE